MPDDAILAPRFAPSITERVATVNTIPGSLWTYIGPTFGADWVELDRDPTFQAQMVVTDDEMDGITQDSSIVLARSSPVVPTAEQIFNWAIAALPTLPAPSYDGFRSVVVSPPGQTVYLTNGVGAYVINSTGRASLDAPFPVSVIYEAIGIADADNSAIWAMNAILTDNRGQVLSSHGNRLLAGIEIDFQVTSPNTEVGGIALYLGGPSLPLVPPPAYAVYINPNAAAGSKWGYGFGTQAGSVFEFAHVGAMAATGANVNSQPIDFYYRNAANVEKFIELQAWPGFLVVAAQEGAGFGSLSLLHGSFYAAGGGGLFVRGNFVVGASTDGLDVFIAPDTMFGSIEIGNGHAFINLSGPVNADRINLRPVSAPANPSTGWVIYTDTADLKVKLKKSDGTIVVLTP